MRGQRDTGDGVQSDRCGCGMRGGGPRAMSAAPFKEPSREAGKEQPVFLLVGLSSVW